MEHESIRTSLVRIGNSQGIRLPKSLLSLSGIERDVEVSVVEGAIVIRAARKARSGWAEQFKAMTFSGDDTLVLEYLPTEWDEQEWEWK
jgi:antitoxin MazE